MAYDVTKTDGTRLTIVADRTIDTTSPIKLVGKNYAGYGEIMAENLVQLLENFSNPSAPANPIIGQLWYNSSLGILGVYTSGGWAPIGGLGIIGGSVTGFSTATIKDTGGVFHQAIKIRVNSVNVAIISSDAGTYTPALETGLQSAFPTIGQGINLNQSGTADVGEEAGGNFKIRGRAVEAEFADMAEIYLSDTELVPGNLVKLGGQAEITKTECEFDDEIFGVISTAPGFLLNAKEKFTELAYPVALKGRVPCLVTGPVKKGERIVASSIPGVGMAAERYDPRAIIGRAISAKAHQGLGTIELAVGNK
jgi:hypothetical protein